ncbi:hypothetical protein B0T17DRAFT_613876 [Bombardia bombarda]|uniref:Uncharacterized protein n=1 Tax=Bombardia bombarda TaxID=252184 RepID=A0AA40CHC2_9PEZI|nr:hypothetical protein B0T17DRAFT_613876 [Bombardia bombarda]
MDGAMQPNPQDEALNRPSSKTNRESIASDLTTDSYVVDLKSGLNDCFDAIETIGTFAAFSKVNPASLNPDIIPLQEDQARQLIHQARQAPYGKGSDTFVDVSVRNTWELDASQFAFQNQELWAHSIDRCCKFVAQQLGITSPISAEPYKMLIYEKGATFKAHTDTKKIPSMFGTLIICLPSAPKSATLLSNTAARKRSSRHLKRHRHWDPSYAGTQTEATWNAQAAIAKKQSTRSQPVNPPPVGRALRPETLAGFIKHKWDDELELLSKQIVSKVNSTPVTELTRLWITFLHALISTLDAALAPLSTPAYQQLASAILDAYLNKYLGKEPSDEWPGFRRERVSCRCENRSTLNAFLDSPTREEWHFSANLKYRKHVESQLEDSKSGRFTSTERWGSPHALVVVKGHANAGNGRKAWGARLDWVQKQLARFDDFKLRQLLDVDYAKITGMGHLYRNDAAARRAAAAAANPRPPAQPSPWSGPSIFVGPGGMRSVFGVKRPAEDGRLDERAGQRW